MFSSASKPGFWLHLSEVPNPSSYCWLVTKNNSPASTSVDTFLLPL